MSVVFLNTSNVQSEKEINKAITLTIVLKRTKCLEINIPKTMEDFYTENYEKTAERNSERSK